MASGTFWTLHKSPLSPQPYLMRQNENDLMKNKYDYGQYFFTCCLLSERERKNYEVIPWILSISIIYHNALWRRDWVSGGKCKNIDFVLVFDSEFTSPDRIRNLFFVVFPHKLDSINILILVKNWQPKSLFDLSHCSAKNKFELQWNL